MRVLWTAVALLAAIAPCWASDPSTEPSSDVLVTEFSGTLDQRAVYRVRTMEGDELIVRVRAEGFEPVLSARNSARRGASVRSKSGELKVRSGGFIEREVAVEGGQGPFTLTVTRVPFLGSYEVDSLPFADWMTKAGEEAVGGVEAFGSFIGPKMEDSFTDGGCKLVPEDASYCHTLSEYVGRSCFFIDWAENDLETGRARLAQLESVIHEHVGKNPLKLKEDVARKEYQTFFPGTVVREAEYWSKKKTARVRLWDNHHDQVTVQLKVCFDQ